MKVIGVSYVPEVSLSETQGVAPVLVNFYQHFANPNFSGLNLFNCIPARRRNF